ncbi:hypothetical protein BHM03_00034860 [Ensete ventricosum]|nr:hypothetical protein BHM03_00034860 [Ensete ventricosum]
MLVGTARKTSTFEWYVSSSDDLTELKGRHEATGTGGPEDQLGNADLLRHCSCEDHQVVGYDAGNAGHVGGGVELQQKLRKRGRTVPLYREPQLDQPIRASVIRLRHAVRNGHEPEGLGAAKRAGPAGAQELPAAELGVDEGDVEASGLKQLRQLQHRVQLPCGGVRDEHRMGVHLLLHLVFSLCGIIQHGERSWWCLSLL